MNRSNISVVEFTKRPPLDDCDLLEKLCQGGEPLIHLRFEHRPMTLNMLRRVMDVAIRGAGIQVVRLHVQEMSFLSGYDGPDFLATSGFPRELMGSLESAKITIMLQKNVHGQIRELSSALFDASKMQHLALSVFEYPTDEFLNAPEFRQHDNVFTSTFAPMLDIMTPTERRIKNEEEEGRYAGQLLASYMTGQNLLAIAPPVPALESMITALGAPVAPGAPVALGAPCALGAAGALMPTLKYLHRHVWDETVNAILDRRLPMSLVTLSISVIMPKQPRTGFLEGLRSLKSLNLSFCVIGDSAFATLSRVIADELPSLLELSLCRNNLSDACDIGAIVGPSLQSLDLSFNAKIGGPGATSLFRRLTVPGTRLAYVNLSNTRFRSPGLSFDGLDRWAVPNAHLVIPNLFSEDEVQRIEACMPEGGVLELDGPRCCPESLRLSGGRTMMLDF